MKSKTKKSKIKLRTVAAKQRFKDAFTAEEARKIVIVRSVAAKQRFDEEAAAAEKLAQEKQALQDRVEHDKEEAAIFQQLPLDRKELGEKEYLRRCKIIEDDLRSKWPKPKQTVPDKDSEEFRLWKRKAGLIVSPTRRARICL